MVLTAVNRSNSFMQFAIVLFLFVAVLGVTLWTSRWIAGYQKERMSGTNMEIIDTMRLSTNQYIQIVRIGEKYIAIAVSKDSVCTLAEIPEEQLHFPAQDRGGSLRFSDFLDKAKKIKNVNSENTSVLEKTDEKSN